MRNSGGFSLLEILIAIAIVGILAMLAVDSFKDMNEKYGVESETKQMYADLMEARARAMQRNRNHFVRITGTGYTVYDDVNPWPDGNRTLETGSDNAVISATVKHAISTNLPTASGISSLDFNSHGIASSSNGYIRLAVSSWSTALPDYDCISIRETRINTGQFSGGACVEK